MKRIYLSIVFSSLLLGSILAQSNDVKIFKKKQNEFGLINSTNNKVVLAPKYSDIEPLDMGLFAIKNKEGLIGVVSKNGLIIIPEKYDDVKLLGVNNFQVKKNGRYGIIDFSNKEILPIKYIAFTQISDNLFEFTDGYKKGYITKYGYVIIPAEYDSLNRLTPSCYIVSQNGKYGIIDDIGKVVIPIKYDKITSTPQDGYSSVKFNNKEGLIDNYTLKLVLDTSYDSIVPDPVGFLLKSEDKIGFFTKSGKLITPVFSRVMFEQPEFGLAVVKQGDKLGFITSEGFVLPPIYDNISRFSNKGIAFVEKAGKLQAVNLQGKEMTLQDLTRGYQTPP